MLVWIAGGVLSLLGALTYAELAAIKPDAGGIYVYIRDACGSFVAFLYGWALFFVISSATIATLAVAFAGYLGQFIPLSIWESRAVAAGMVMRARGGERHRHSTKREHAELDDGDQGRAPSCCMSALMLTKGEGLAEVQLFASSGQIVVGARDGRGADRCDVGL